MRAGRVPRPGGGGRQARVRTFLRHAETRRAGARARQRAQAAVAGRAGERPQSRGSGRARQADSRHPRPAWRHRASGGAPHEPGDERLRQGGRAQLRAQDRGGHAGRGAAAPRSGAGLFGEQRLMATLLEVSNLHAAYGPTRVLHGIDFVLEDGSITALLGANGARIDGRATEDIVRLGIAHVPDGRGTFVNLSTEENLRLGAYVRKDKRAVEQDFERIYTYFPRLKERRHQQAGTLSGGEQQMLAVSRALMLRPRLLLLDAPSFGLAPLLVREIFDIMRAINQSEKVSILLVEQNAAMALDLADHAYLIETGRVVLSGSAGEIKQNDAVRRSYLGY